MMRTIEPRTKSQKTFVSDCEGPISKNDNAYELTAHFLPDGAHFFSLISRYDDVLADVAKKPGYKPGDTLRLILPFLKAYGATNAKMTEYSSKHILLVPGAAETLRLVNLIMPSFIVSTSYEQYIFSLCDLINFSHENVYCTKLDIDKYVIDPHEITRLRELREEISSFSMVEIPKDARSVSDLSQRDQETIGRLDEIFWSDLSEMKSGRMMKDVNPVGGYEKAKAVQNIKKRTKINFQNVMYIGDSITDVAPFEMIRESGGLTVSFNGNQYAIREAEVAVLSKNTVVTSILADVFNKQGREGVTQLIKEWGYPALQKFVDPTLRKLAIALYPTKLPQVELINEENRDRLSEESCFFRKTVRGEAVGGLG